MRLDLAPWLIMAAVISIISVAILMAWPVKLKAHSFYDAYCCSGQDCEPIDPQRVRPVTGGYMLDETFFIPEDGARQAPDGNYHACFWPNPETLRCFYKPTVGS